jgi:hypothetical protein
MNIEHIDISLESTDIPEFPSTPIQAHITFMIDRLQIFLERSGTIAADVRFQFDIHQKDIMAVNFKIVPDVPDDFQYSPRSQPNCSLLTIIHKDPYGVVPSFSTTFDSPKSYWIKAFVKLLKDKLSIDAQEIATTDKK